MITNRFQMPIGNQSENVSVESLVPDEPVAVLVLAHGAGAGMDHSFMIALAEELAMNQVATLRYNFLYMEQKKRRPDFPAVAHQVVEAAVQQARKLFPDLPLFVSGKSFGGRMSSQYLAKNHLDYVKGIVFFGFPLHPAGKPSIARAEHLKSLRVPMLFLQGTRDDLAEWSLIHTVCAELALATLKSLDGVTHSLMVKKKVAPDLAPYTSKWVASIVAAQHGVE